MTTRVNMKIHEVEQVSIQRNVHPCVLLILASFLNFFRRVPQTPKAKNCDLIKTREYHVHDNFTSPQTELAPLMMVKKYRDNHKSLFESLICPKTHSQRIAVLVHNYLWFERCVQRQHVTNV